MECHSFSLFISFFCFLKGYYWGDSWIECDVFVTRVGVASLGIQSSRWKSTSNWTERDSSPLQANSALLKKSELYIKSERTVTETCFATVSRENLSIFLSLISGGKNLWNWKLLLIILEYCLSRLPQILKLHSILWYPIHTIYSHDVFCC